SSIGYIGAWPAPNLSDRPFMNLRTTPDDGAVGRRPITKSKSHVERSTTRQSGPWHINGFVFCSVAGSSDSLTRKKSICGLWPNNSDRSCKKSLVLWKSFESHMKFPIERKPQISPVPGGVSLLLPSHLLWPRPQLTRL